MSSKNASSNIRERASSGLTRSSPSMYRVSSPRTMRSTGKLAISSFIMGISGACPALSYRRGIPLYLLHPTPSPRAPAPTSLTKAPGASTSNPIPRLMLPHASQYVVPDSLPMPNVWVDPRIWVIWRDNSPLGSSPDTKIDSPPITRSTAGRTTCSS